MEEEGTLKDEIRMLRESVEQGNKKKVRKFRLPFSGKIGRGKVKRNYASICYINENREVKFTRAPIEEGIIMIDGAPHVATTDHLLTYRNKPFLIIPSWNTTPFSPQKDLDKAMREKTISVGYRLLLNKIKYEAIKPKSRGGFGIVIFGLLIAGVAAYYFFGGGGT